MDGPLFCWKEKGLLEYFIKILSYKLRERQKERERESGETGREGEKQKERGERQTEKERSSWCHCGKVA